MGLTRKRMLGLIGAAAAGSAAASLSSSGAQAASDTADATGARVIRRDVCVIGGGSAGTYAAVRLGDLGRSVAVVEARDRLGGHTETYHDPETGGTVDIGVIVFEDEPLVRDYFGRFGVGLTPIGGFGGASTYVDFRTGRKAAKIAVPAALGAGAVAAAITVVVALNRRGALRRARRYL